MDILAVGAELNVIQLDDDDDDDPCWQAYQDICMWHTLKITNDIEPATKVAGIIRRGLFKTPPAREVYPRAGLRFYLPYFTPAASDTGYSSSEYTEILVLPALQSLEEVREVGKIRKIRK